MFCIIAYDYNDYMTFISREEWLEKYVHDARTRVVYFGSDEECLEYMNSSEEGKAQDNRLPELY